MALLFFNINVKIISNVDVYWSIHHIFKPEIICHGDFLGF